MPLYRETSTEFHPEFGYLVPTRKLRNTMRVALAAAVFGVIVGVVGAMVLLPRIDRDLRTARAASDEPAATVGVAVVAPAAVAEPARATQSGEGQPASTGRTLVAPDGSPKGAPAKSAAPAATGVDADKPCKEETWPYFDSKCLWGGPAKEASAPAPGAGTEPAATTATPLLASPPEQRHVAATKRKAKAAPARRRHRDNSETRSASSRSYGYRYASPYGLVYGNGYDFRRGFGW